MSILHASIHGLLAGSPPEVDSSIPKFYSFLLYDKTDDTKQSEVILVVASQSNLLRSLISSEYHLDHNLLMLLQHDYGPLSWLRMLDGPIAAKYLEQAARCIFKAASLVGDEIKLDVYMVGLQCMFLKVPLEWQEALEYFCRCISSTGSSQSFELANQYANRFIEHSQTPETKLESTTLKIMSERMTNLARKLRQPDMVTYWSKKRLSNSSRSTEVHVMLDHASVTILSDTTASLHVLEEVAHVLVQADTTQDTEADSRLLLKSLLNMRTILFNKKTSSVLSTSMYYVIVSAVLSIFHQVVLRYSGQYSTLTPIMRGFIEGFFKVNDNSKVGPDTCQIYLKIFTCCHSIATLLKSGETLNMVGIHLYNSGGISYLNKNYAEAALCFELGINLGFLDMNEPHKLEYLWSSYLLVRNYPLAYRWLIEAFICLERAGQIAALTSQATSLYTVAELQQTYPEICRVVAKLTMLNLINTEFRLSCMSDCSENAENFAVLQELQLLHLCEQATCDVEYAQKIWRQILAVWTEQHAPHRRLRILLIALRIASQNRHENAISELLSEAAGNSSWFAEANPSFSVFYHRNLLALYLKSHDGLSVSRAIEDAGNLLAEEDSASDINVLDLVELLKALELEAVRHHRPKDVLRALRLAQKVNQKASELHVHIPEDELLRIELDMAEWCLECGIELSAKINLINARSIVEGDKQIDHVLRARYLALEMKFSLLGDRAAELSGLIDDLTDLISRTSGSANAMCNAIHLSVQSNDQEAKGYIASAVKLELASYVARQKCASRFARREKLVASPAKVKADLPEGTSISLDHAHLDASTVHQIGSRIYATNVGILICLRRLSTLFEKCGIIREALFYMNEASVMAESIKIPALELEVRLQAYRLNKHLNQVHSTETLLRSELEQLQNPISRAEFMLLSAESIWATDTPLNTCDAYNNALHELKPDNLSGNWTFLLPDRPPYTTPPKRTRKDNSVGPNEIWNSRRLEQLRNSIWCEIAREAQNSGQLELYTSTMHTICSVKTDIRCTNVSYAIACNYMQAAEVRLTQDPVYGVLQDSALSLPSIRQQEVTISALTGHKSRRPEQQNWKTTAENHRKTRSLLEDSRACLIEDFISVLSCGQSYDPYRLGILYTTLNLTLSALLRPVDHVAQLSALSYLHLELSRALTLNHESIYHRPDTTSKATHSWLDTCAISHATETANPHLYLLDDLPTDWKVISISLGITGTDLIISQVQTGKAPLIIKLPLARHSARDADESVFEYQTAKSELNDIIHQSNESARAAKNIKDKHGKLEWWQQRQTLDSRMKTLLDNMERCWLGGFKGMLRATPSRSGAGEEFRAAFIKVIVKHVIFRQIDPLDIDDRVLDLFTDLGPVTDDESLELLEDLLYFVLDIYQFHGESIAYDEVDIDQMTIDIQGAITSHHKANSSDTYGHTVLILDNCLNRFPWESMPCLSRTSISRIPSISMLHDLMQSRSQMSGISRRNGRYILNPSGDLKSTQKTFHETISTLPGWDGMTARKPLESELIQYLSESDIYLYFGHGGGEQFIRASKIKTIENCPVAILMGCSSGALKDQGKFDPWGTPYNYLVAKR